MSERYRQSRRQSQRGKHKLGTNPDTDKSWCVFCRRPEAAFDGDEDCVMNPSHSEHMSPEELQAQFEHNQD